MSPDELILMPVLKANPGTGGSFVLTRKYIEGAAEFARFWPGPVTSLVRMKDEPTTDMDLIEVMPGDTDSGIENRPPVGAALERRLERAAAVLGFLHADDASTARFCHGIGVPFFCTTEYSPHTERQIVDAEVRNPLLRWRRKIWLHRHDRVRQSMLPYLAGLQCSGTPTYELYRERHPNVLMFFDNRVRAGDVIAADRLAHRLTRITSGAPLRLVFGGRLVAMKGVMDLPRIAQALDDRAVPFTLEIYGTGPLEDAMRDDIAARGLTDRVTMPGAFDFQTGWIPALRDRADLFLCCHLQGDPSSTYPEVMSCGVPIAGYDNEALLGITQHSAAGWATPLGDPDALAEQVAQLHADRPRLVAAAQSAVAFARAHTFELTFEKRVRHLIESSRLPAALRSG